MGVPCASHLLIHPFLGVSWHEGIVPPAPAPVVMPHVTFGIVNGFLALGSYPTVGHKNGDVLAWGLLPLMGRGTDAGYVVPHISTVQFNTMQFLTTAMGESKIMFGSSSVKLPCKNWLWGEEVKDAGCCVFPYAPLSLNLGCNEAIPTPTDLVFAPSTLYVGMSLADYVTGLIDIGTELAFAIVSEAGGELLKKGAKKGLKKFFKKGGDAVQDAAQDVGQKWYKKAWKKLKDMPGELTGKAAKEAKEAAQKQARLAASEAASTAARAARQAAGEAAERARNRAIRKGLSDGAQEQAARQARKQVIDKARKKAASKAKWGSLVKGFGKGLWEGTKSMADKVYKETFKETVVEPFLSGVPDAISGRGYHVSKWGKWIGLEEKEDEATVDGGSVWFWWPD